jgi:hypothetical protein
MSSSGQGWPNIKAALTVARCCRHPSRMSILPAMYCSQTAVWRDPVLLDFSGGLIDGPKVSYATRTAFCG